MAMRHLAVMAGLALGLMAGAANAAPFTILPSSGTDVFTNLASFDSAVTGTSNVTFNNILQNGQPFQTHNSLTAGGVTFTDNSHPFDITEANYYGPAHTYPSPFLIASDISKDDTLTVTLPKDTEAFGLDFGSFLGNPVVITLSNGTVVTDASTPGVGQTEFLGFQSSSNIGSFTITSPNDYYVVQDLVLVSAVPLPASAPMFGAALLALGAVGYGLKRKGKAAA